MYPKGLKTCAEAVLLVVVGLGLGLSANAASDDGIRLNRDYFRKAGTPGPLPTSSPMPTATPAPQAGDEAAPTTPAEAETEPVPPGQQLPYQTMSHDDVVTLYTSPEYEFEQSIIIDARDDSHYLEGHIPGAFQLDHYRLEQYLPAVLGACQSATRIVVYCNGGKCEDSELAALDLMDEGIDPNKIFVYVGGAAEWTRAGLPFERGERLSQDLYNPQTEE